MAVKEDVYWGNVAQLGDCWVWFGPLDRQGYGKAGGTSAHRISYELMVASIPEGLELDHLCRRPACINPYHLDPVTRAVNMRRRVAAKTHCVRGHEFSPKNTRIQWDGSRRCRTCSNAAANRSKARAKAAAR